MGWKTPAARVDILLGGVVIPCNSFSLPHFTTSWNHQSPFASAQHSHSSSVLWNRGTCLSIAFSTSSAMLKANENNHRIASSSPSVCAHEFAAVFHAIRSHSTYGSIPRIGLPAIIWLGCILASQLWLFEDVCFLGFAQKIASTDFPAWTALESLSAISFS